MPKMKTKRGAAKRFKKTSSGKIKCFSGNKSHLLTHKGRKRKRRLRKAGILNQVNVKGITKLIPYA